MFLLVVAVFIIFVHFEIRFSAFQMLQNLSYLLHQKCLIQIPTPTIYTPALSALVCGENFNSVSEAQLYTSTGLIHLFVVSGSHLILIQKMMKKVSLILFKKEFSIFIIIALFFYAAVCQFNPPVTRSFIFLFLSYLVYKLHRYWSSHYTLLLSGLIALIFNPDWITSLSLQMSWLAALALQMYAEKLKHTSILVQQILLYFLFLFCFRLLGFPQFSAIVVCILLTPILEYFLFPVALLVWAVPFFEPFFALLMDALNTLLNHLEYRSVPSHIDAAKALSLNWIMIFGCHFLLFFRRPKS